MPVWLTREPAAGGSGTRTRAGGTEQALARAKTMNNKLRWVIIVVSVAQWRQPALLVLCSAIIQKSAWEKSITEQISSDFRAGRMTFALVYPV